MTKHVPTPWRLAPAKDYAGTELNIDAGERGTGGFICTAGHRGDEEAEANAALIVEAVNAHEALVSALRVCAGMLACTQSDRSVIKFTGAWAHLGSMTVGQALDMADAALGSASAGTGGES